MGVWKKEKALDMNYIIVTNNDRCIAQYQTVCSIVYHEEWIYLDVLLYARDLIHKGAILITHPMAGSLKPNQTPYRSIVLGAHSLTDKKPFEDVRLIENSISACKKFLKYKPLTAWSPTICEDFKTVDLSLIECAIGPASVLNQKYSI